EQGFDRVHHGRLRGRRGSGQIHPFSAAARTASARLVTPSFPIAEEMWLRTVPSERNRASAMRAVVPPAAAACSTSVSFSVSGLEPTASDWAASSGSTTRRDRKSAGEGKGG